MDLLDFICKWVSELLEGSDVCCEYLIEEDDKCEETCNYSSAQPECWKRYFTEKYKELQQTNFCRCGGRLSEVRYHNDRPYRHCFDCHREYYEDGDKS